MTWQIVQKVKPLGFGEIHKTEIKEAAASIAKELHVWPSQGIQLE